MSEQEREVPYFHWKEWDVPCRRCGWVGKGTETKAGESFSEVFSRVCPRCENEVLTIAWPTVAEALANRDKLSPESAAHYERIQANEQARAATWLQDPAQLPELEGDVLELTWELEWPDQVILHGTREVWRETATYESYRRFGQMAKLLKARYGARLRDLVPTPGSEMFLYGDCQLADQHVGQARWLLKH